MKTATLITGAFGGLGSTLVDMASSLDTDCVIATDHPSQINGKFDSNPKVFSFGLDVTDETNIKDVREKIHNKGIVVKHLINNAGIMTYFPISEATTSLLEKITRVNTFGPVLMVSNFIDDLISNKGRVIQISSVSVKTPFTFMPYPVSKIALEGFSTAMRQELSLHGVKLVIVRPGAMDTNLISEMKEIPNPIPNSKYAKEFDKFTAKARKHVGKMVHPSEVASLIKKILNTDKPKFIYSINENKAVSFFSRFPARLRDKLVLKQVQ